MKRHYFLLFALSFIPLAVFGQKDVVASNIFLFPADKATGVNPDVQLEITFPEKPVLKNAGQIRVYDLSNDELVDVLDLSIPPGPKNTRTPEPYDSFVYPGYSNKLFRVNDADTTWRSESYQKNYIGGNTDADAYNFYPVLINGNTATISLHNNHLEYNRTYYVEVDPGVLSLDNDEFQGILGRKAWVFNTKKAPPAASSKWLVVAKDGSGDFNTVQGAVDFVPNNNPERIHIFIKNGRYEEIVYFRNKENISFIGEDREKVIVCYPNNGVFNTNPGHIRHDPSEKVQYHNQRAVFMVHNSNSINIVNLTLKSLGEEPAQAEALLILGDENIVSNVTIDGSGDALQATGKIYVADSQIKGFGDNVLGYGSVFFNNVDFVSTYGPHLWVRNTRANHGNVLFNCTLRTIGDVETVIARAPDSNGKTYPYVEVVLINSRIEGIRPEGWGKVADKTDDIRYWEYNTTYLSSGKPVDTSLRHPVSRQLTMENDAEIIAKYSDPKFVLGGWSPVMAPIILSQPRSMEVKKGQKVNLKVEVAAIPEASYQWYKDGKAIPETNSPIFTKDKLKESDSGIYTLMLKNNEGSVKSQDITLKVD